MATSLAAPVVQVCAFALGCAVIHAMRGHAAALTRLLVPIAAIAAAFVLLVGSLICAPVDGDCSDQILVFGVLSDALFASDLNTGA